MKSFKILGIALLLISELNHSCSTSIESFDLELSMHRMTNTLSRDLNEFKSNNPQLNYGINSIKNLYDSGINIEELYGTGKHHSCLRNTLFNLEIITGGGCGVLRCLSVFHPNNEFFSKALIGGYIGKAIFWGLYSYLHNSANQASISLINAAQTDPLLVSTVSKMLNEVNGINFSPILNISKKVIDIVKQKDPSEYEINKLERLQTLIDKMSDLSKFKKVIGTGGKILSFIIGAATGITIAATGQYSNPSYWLTLITSGFDPIVDCINTRTTSKSIIEKYVMVSEIVYLCSEFINGHEDFEA